MFQTGTLKPGEICPGLTWEEHADSVARFLDNRFYKENGHVAIDHSEFAFSKFRNDVLDFIDGDPQEVKDKYAKLERNS